MRQPSANDFVIELDPAFFATNALKAESLGGIRLVLKKIYPAQKRIDGVYCSYELQTMSRKNEFQYDLKGDYDPKKSLFEQYTKLLEGTKIERPKEITVDHVDDDVSPAEAENTGTLIPSLGAKPHDSTDTKAVLGTGDLELSAVCP